MQPTRYIEPSDQWMKVAQAIYAVETLNAEANLILKSRVTAAVVDGFLASERELAEVKLLLERAMLAQGVEVFRRDGGFIFYKKVEAPAPRGETCLDMVETLGYKAFSHIPEDTWRHIEAILLEAKGHLVEAQQDLQKLVPSPVYKRVSKHLERAIEKPRKACWRRIMGTWPSLGLTWGREIRFQS